MKECVLLAVTIFLSCVFLILLNSDLSFDSDIPWLSHARIHSIIMYWFMYCLKIKGTRGFSSFYISNHNVMRKIIITGICSENWELCTISLSHVQLKTIPCNMCKGKFRVKKLSFFYLQKNKTDSKNREEKAMSQWESWRAIDRQPDLIISHHRPREKPD